MAAQPRISTVIPTYNRAQKIAAAIESALGQTYPAELHEVIVVDDGSNDHTADVVGKYAPRVRYLTKPNGGVSSARNHGVQHATGELIAFLDSDDRWLPSKLTRQVELLSARPDLGLVVTDVEFCSDDGSPPGRWRRRTLIPHDGAVLPEVLRSPWLLPSSAVVRKSIFDAVGGFDETLRSAEDLDFHLNVANVTGVGLVEEPLTQYLRHDASLSNEITTYDTYVLVIERFVARHPELPARLRRESLARAYVQNARGLLSMGKYKKGLRYALTAARHARGAREAKMLATLAPLLVRSTASRTVKRLLKSLFGPA